MTSIAGLGTQEPDARRERLVGLACAGTVVVLWSGFLLLSRYGLSTGDLGLFDFGALRYGISGIIMAPVLFVIGPGNLTLFRGLALALTAGIGFGMLAYFGFSMAPAAHAAVLMPGSLPLYTSILAVAFLGERLGWMRSIALGLILLGILSLASSAITSFSWQQLKGDLCFMAAAMSWAIFTILLRAWNVDPLRGVATLCVGAAAIYVPIWLVFIPMDALWNAPLDTLLIQGTYQGIIATIIAMIVFSRAVKALGAAVTTMITAVTPGAVSLLAIPVLGEALSIQAAIGVGLVTLGIFGTVLSLKQQS